MPDADLIRTIHTKFIAVLTELNERGTRRWKAAEALAIGRGGISADSNAIGLSRVTIRKGIAELSSAPLLPDRQRRPGAGRKTRESEQPSLIMALEKLVDSGTRGDPESPLKWTIKSTRAITRQLRRQNFSVGSTKVGELLKTRGYSLQANRKTIEGKQHPDRNHNLSSSPNVFDSKEKSRNHPFLSIQRRKKFWEIRRIPAASCVARRNPFASRLMTSQRRN
jgi:transposase